MTGKCEMQFQGYDPPNLASALTKSNGAYNQSMSSVFRR